MSKSGIEFKESLYKETSGFDECINKLYANESMMKERQNEFNPLQKYIVDSVVKLIDKGEPFFANCQGGGGTGKSFIIKYIAAK